MHCGCAGRWGCWQLPVRAARARGESQSGDGFRREAAHTQPCAQGDRHMPQPDTPVSPLYWNTHTHTHPPMLLLSHAAGRARARFCCETQPGLCFPLVFQLSSLLIPSSPRHWENYLSLKPKNNPSCREPGKGELFLANSHSTHTQALSWPSFLPVSFIQQEPGTHRNERVEARHPRAEEGGCWLGGPVPPEAS